jgi:nucleoside-diphosphate-sugar epimerase
VKVLVTGATGCVGRAVVRTMLDAGHAVRGVWRGVAPADAGLPAAGPGLEWVRAELTRDDPLPLALGCDAVVHLAALVHHPEVRDPAAYMLANATVTANLHDAAIAAGLRRGRFVFASTVAVYGRDYDLHADETTPVAPLTPYGRSKLAGEAAVRERNGVVLRLPITYGPGDRGNMAQLIRAVAAGRFALPGACDKPRSFLAAENAAHAVACALALPQPPGDDLFLVTDQDDRSTRGVVTTIAAALAAGGRPAPPVREAPYALVWAAALAGSALGATGLRVPVTLSALRKLTTGLTFSSERARAQLGYAPVRRFDVALGDAVAAIDPA